MFELRIVTQLETESLSSLDIDRFEEWLTILVSLFYLPRDEKKGEKEVKKDKGTGGF